MSRKVNYTMIGVFVVAALAVAVTGILILGAGKFFRDTKQFVVYFTGSLSGLDVGAPVEYRGVRIGSVNKLHVEYDSENAEISIPVYIQLEPDRMHYSLKPVAANAMEYHIKKGLRAQLQSQSYITGKLKITLVEKPDTPVLLVGGDPEVMEIPSVPRTMESLVERIEDLPFEQMVRDLAKSINALAETTGSEEMKGILSETREVVEGLSDIVNSSELNQSLKSLSETLDESRRLVAEARKSAAPVQQELHQTLAEISDAARAARNLMDYLERHPEAMIHGKGEE